jgi:preprotein translocase subunit SecE
LTIFAGLVVCQELVLPCGAFLITEMFNLLNYIKETRTELRHVSWPTRKQAINFTVLVIVGSLVVAALLGLFDRVFDFILTELILDIDTSAVPPDIGGVPTHDGVNVEVEDPIEITPAQGGIEFEVLPDGDINDQ